EIRAVNPDSAAGRSADRLGPQRLLPICSTRCPRLPVRLRARVQATAGRLSPLEAIDGNRPAPQPPASQTRREAMRAHLHPDPAGMRSMLDSAGTGDKLQADCQAAAGELSGPRYPARESRFASALRANLPARPGLGVSARYQSEKDRTATRCCRLHRPV